MGEYLSTIDVADKLGIPKRSVQRLIREGRIKSIKVGKEYRVHPDDLDQFIVDAEIVGKSIYSNLEKYLKTVNHDSETMSYERVEEILRFKLPASATMYRAWWGNDASHVQAQAWLNAGWRVENVTLGREVKFERLK